MLPQLAQGDANKVFVVPSEFAAAFGGIGEALSQRIPGTDTPSGPAPVAPQALASPQTGSSPQEGTSLQPGSPQQPDAPGQPDASGQTGSAPSDTPSNRGRKPAGRSR
jgi:hypothetical protein